MNGIKYIIDERGVKTAVVIDLRKYAALWEDFQDNLVTQQRATEPRESLELVKKKLKRQNKVQTNT